MKSSLTSKIIAIVSGLALGIFILFIYIDIQRQNFFNLQINRDKAVSVAFALDTNIKTTKDLEDISRLTNIIQKNILLNSDIEEIKINVKKGDQFFTIASNIPDHIQYFSDTINDKSLTIDSSVDEIYTVSKNNRIFKSVSPIHGLGENIGTYEILINLNRLDKQFFQETLQIVVLNSMLLIIFIGIFYIFLHNIVISPLNKVSEGFKQVSIGNFEYRLAIYSHDEFEYVGQIFNTMVSDLSKANNALTYHQKELEDTVALKTVELHKKIEELEKVNSMMTGRELKMVELKKEIEQLKQAHSVHSTDVQNL
jgi:methyl-accepting chemotaxis protein